MKYFNVKPEANNLKKVSVTWLKRNGYLREISGGSLTWNDEFTGKESSIGICVSLERSVIKLSYWQTNENEERKT